MGIRKLFRTLGSHVMGSETDQDVLDGSAEDRLTALPNELLSTILGQLLPSGPVLLRDPAEPGSRELEPSYLVSRRTLAALCRTSRPLNRAATRHLYRIALLRDETELRCFCRTLTAGAGARHLVRSLAWLGWLKAPEDARAGAGRPKDHGGGRWPSVEWSSSGEDADIFEALEFGSTNRVEAWQIFGAVLGMLPALQSLLMTTTCPKTGPSLEELALAKLLIVPRPPRRRPAVLQHLRHLVIEQPPDVRLARTITHPRLVDILKGLPSLERLEMTGSYNFGHWDDGEERIQGLVLHGVREVAMLLTTNPLAEANISAMIFSGLEVLEIQSAGFPFGWEVPETRARGLKEPLETAYKTLKRLSLTSGPPAQWRNVLALPPHLPAVDKMECLTHLTTESSWVFGRPDRQYASILAQLLPESLACLTLIDFWGSEDPFPYWKLRGLEFGAADVVGFCEAAFSELLEARRVRSSALQEIAFGIPRNSVVWCDEDVLRSFSNHFQVLFQDVGAHFHVTLPYVSTQRPYSRWADIGSEVSEADIVV